MTGWVRAGATVRSGALAAAAVAGSIGVGVPAGEGTEAWSTCSGAASSISVGRRQ